MMGYDVAPVYSPDGKKIAWQSMERDGYESDKNRLFVIDLATALKPISQRALIRMQKTWPGSNDSKSIFFTSDYHATDEIYRLDITDGKIEKLTDGIHDYTGVFPAGNKLIATQMSMSSPVELFSVDPQTKKETQITFTNKEIFDQLALGTIEKRWIKTTDNKEELTWIIYPPHFDKTKKYPTLLYCEGGPQSTVSQFWSFRWKLPDHGCKRVYHCCPQPQGITRLRP